MQSLGRVLAGIEPAIVAAPRGIAKANRLAAAATICYSSAPCAAIPRAFGLPVRFHGIHDS